LQKFPVDSEVSDYAKLLEAHPGSYELLSKVAKAHFDGGDYERSLKVYLALLEWLSPFEKAKRAEVLEKLGDIYTKSGFMQRSVEAYAQSLSLVARNSSALSKISNIYEKRADYEKALEALEALEEMGFDEKLRSGFLQGVLSLKTAQTFDEKMSVLASLCGSNDYFAREYLRELLYVDQKKAAEFLEQNSGIHFLDILWNTKLDKESFVQCENVLVKGVLEAKGVLSGDTQSGVFELDVVSAANRAKPDLKADLSFEFVCKKCGTLDIDYFFSCKCCAAIGECKVLVGISKQSSDTLSFLESW
jgi:tetratricopeptide (TPR) repeat protein